MALEVLRSHPESVPAKTGPDLDSYLLDKERANLEAARREKAISGTPFRRRKTMTAINRMGLLVIQEQLRIKAGIEKTSMFAGYRQTIDNRGVGGFLDSMQSFVFSWHRTAKTVNFLVNF